MLSVTGLFTAAATDAGVFSLDTQTFISVGIMLFNACLLAVVLSLVLYKPVSKYLRKRAQWIKGQLSSAEDAVDKADKYKALYEQKLEDVEKERTEILESANALAAERSEQILAQAQEQAAAMKERASMDIQAERERAKEEIRLEIIEVATVMAEKFVAYAIDAQTQNRLFDEAIAELEETVWRS